MKAYAAYIKLRGAKKGVKVGIVAYSTSEAYEKALERFPKAHLSDISIIHLKDVKVKIKIG